MENLNLKTTRFLIFTFIYRPTHLWLFLFTSTNFCFFQRFYFNISALHLRLDIRQSAPDHAHQYPTSPVVNGYVLPVVMKSLFHGTGSVPMDVGHLLLLARVSGILCPKTCGIRRFMRTVTDSLWRRFYLRSTNVFSALEVFTSMRYINPHLTFDAINSIVKSFILVNESYVRAAGSHNQ